MQLLFDSILPTAERLSKLESVLSKAAAALSTKFISYSLFNEDKSHFLLLIFSFLKTLFTYLALVVLGLRCYGGYSLVVDSATLIVVASLVAEHGLWGMWASTVVGRGLSGCGFWALEHRLSSCGSWA